MRRLSLLVLTFVVSLVVGAGGAQAVVVDMGSAGHFGVALVPGTTSSLAVTSSSSNCDPWLSSDLSLLPSIGLCSHGGGVMHSNETFALTWDSHGRYWAGTRDYAEQFLKDVADGSRTFSSPYAVTSQYKDGPGESDRAANHSLYGGACIDYGPGGYTCQFGDTTGTGVGSSYPASACPVTGSNHYCLTDAQLQAELRTHLQRTALLGHLMPGYTPLLVLLTPPDVGVCLDATGTLCSANGVSTEQFCSYHSQVNVGGTEVAYVVQPWTTYTACDEPNLPSLPPHPTAQQLAIDAGMRLVSPLSQGQIAAIVNSGLNGWFAAGGFEINDNYGCAPGGYPWDKVTVGNSPQNPYYLQPEFNNAGVIFTDPNVPACALGVALAPTFVVPSAVGPGDVVQFDGSVTNSTLIVPRANYSWNFGDGTTAIGPSVEHSYAKGGTYGVKLTVTDRGGNVASLSQTITVLGPNGQLVSPPQGIGHWPPTHPALRVRLQFMPQGLRTMLRVGLSVRVSSNERADGIATLSISRRSAKQAHVRTGRGPTVVIGRGTVSGITNGTVNLHLRLSRAMVAKLRHLRHVTLTLRLALVTAGGVHLAIDAAGRY
jgi:hypothetical protein